MKQEHSKKMIAPIVVALIAILYYGIFFVVVFFTCMPLLLKVVMGIVPLMLIGAVLYVLNERINEIRSGDEDDLGNY